MNPALELNGATLETLIGLVFKHTGISMSARKSVLLQGRLRPRLQALSLGSYQDYLERLASDRSEVQVFINMVTTNDTAFFRTPHVWQYLTERFLPTWCAQHPGRTLKIWSAAAASGEEAYSIAMSCAQQQGRTPGFRYRIMATDISTEVLDIGRHGLYGGRSVERLRASHPELLARYFTPQADALAISAALKEQIGFAEHNLLGALLPAQQFDLVLLRNVLIYFDAPSQENVLRQVRRSMAPEGRLILGESESIGRLTTDFRYELPLVYRIGEAGA